MNSTHLSHRVRFLPWKGTRYETGFRGARTLILGESNYQKDGKRFSRRLNIELIGGQADGIGRYTGSWPYWTKIITLLSPEDPDRHQFWHSVAYYNFIQEFTGAVARKRPTSQMWLDARKPFFEILSAG